jgi:hypothetical protein
VKRIVNCVFLVYALYSYIYSTTNIHAVSKFVLLFCGQVKLIKCVIDNVVVDISFNQIGGISTVTFLEEVCRYIMVQLATFS